MVSEPLPGGAPVRIALIGAGRMGSVHLGAMRSSPQIEVVAVVEPAPARRAQLAQEDLPVFSEVDALLTETVPEGVLIAAPSDQHPELVARFAAAEIPMMCEKPLGVRVTQTAKAAQVAQDAGVLLQVGYWRRFVPELRALRSRIAAGELGEISQLTCLQWDEALPSEAFRAHSGGIAVDMGVHEFDQARWLLGQEFDWCSAAAAGPSAQPRPATDPDAATILAGMSGGAAVTVSLGRRFPQPDSCWLEVFGTEGYERVPFMWGAPGDEVFVSAMRRQAEAFARAVRGGGLEGAGGADAVAALGVAEMAAESLGRAGAQVQRAAMVTA
jgi:myo-inositol 2-dehydrogenase/D-chiro-inositol 1-dehydrogenase